MSFDRACAMSASGDVNARRAARVLIDVAYTDAPTVGGGASPALPLHGSTAWKRHVFVASQSLQRPANDASPLYIFRREKKKLEPWPVYTLSAAGKQEGQHELTGQRAANFRRDLGL